MGFRVVTFFTPRYAEAARAMVDSLGDIPHKAYEYEDTGDWTRNTHYKPHALLEAVGEFPDENIVWMDADAKLTGKPDLFDELEGREVDVAHGWLDYKGVQEVLSGTLWLRNCDLVREVLVRWMGSNARTQKHDQLGLAEALGAVPGVRVEKLPPEYCKIFDHPLHTGRAPETRGRPVRGVVTHYQKSRELRREARARRRRK